MGEHDELLSELDMLSASEKDCATCTPCAWARAASALRALVRERDELKEASGKAVCSYCGHVGERDLAVITAHMQACPERKHAEELQIRAHEDTITSLAKERNEMGALITRGVELLEQADAQIKDLEAQLAAATAERDEALKTSAGNRRLAEETEAELAAESEKVARLADFVHLVDDSFEEGALECTEDHDEKRTRCPRNEASALLKSFASPAEAAKEESGG